MKLSPTLARALVVAPRGGSSKSVWVLASASASRQPQWWTQPRALCSSGSRDAPPRDDAAEKQQLSSSSVGRTLVAVARANPDRIAVVSTRGDKITYGVLLSHAETLARTLRATAVSALVVGSRSSGDDDRTNDKDERDDDLLDVLRGARVAVSATPGPEYVSAMYATWMCGAIAVPIARSHTRDEVEYVLRDAGVRVMAMISEDEAARRDLMSSLEAVGVRAVQTPPLLELEGSIVDDDERDDGEEGKRDEDDAAVVGGASSVAATGGRKQRRDGPSVVASLRSAVDEVGGRDATEKQQRRPLPGDVDDGALIIYTSGTTGRPKGVLHTHGTLAAQCAALTSAWAWSPDDVIYHALPLHHIHGIVNAWMCAHFVGARVEFGAGGGSGGHQFAPRAAWRRLRGGDDSDNGGEGEHARTTADGDSAGAGSAADGPESRLRNLRRRGRRLPPITVFMGVPTMYVMMLRTLEGMRRTRPEVAAASAAAAAALRLTVSGSAACPVPVMRQWEQATGGTVLLERYGMTEIGMALSNPLEGERRPGTVGQPLPGVEVKCVPSTEDDLAEAAAGEKGEAAESTHTSGGGGGGVGGGFADVEEGPGELLVRGPMVFKQYWGRPEATAESFVRGGDGGGDWFLTGDTVVREQGGYWRILGRTSVDIIKCGGFKVSALEVEAKLLEHPAVAEVAVFGVPDEAFGEVGAAVVVLRGSVDDADAGGGGGGGEQAPVTTESGLGAWARQHMAVYKAPRVFRFVDKIPRNAMGKVNKKDLRAKFL